jgi:hypothetical protein
MKGRVKLIEEWRREGQLRKCLNIFIEVSRSTRIKVCTKIYDKITKIGHIWKG